jgi:hypothetical protein
MQATPEPFIPLLPTPDSPNGRTQVIVLPQPDNVQPFQPLTPPAAPPPAAPGSTCEPRVSVQREGDRVSTIRIQCSCGETIELACVYDSMAGAPVPVAPPTNM